MAVRIAVFLLIALALGTRTIAVSEDISSKNTCQIEHLYESSLPAGGTTGVQYMKVLGTDLSAERCLAECCSLGPDACQYLWVLKTTCIAVACEGDKISDCQPASVSNIRKGATSVYVALKHLQPSANELEKDLDWMSRFPSGSKGKEDDSGDSPPVAATLTDEIIITMPTNEVKIFGNHSKDDKGITTYSWKLLSEHFVQPLLENVDQAILHARNLIPGNYRFSLTVTDTSGQSSRTTVLVRVNKGPTTTEVATTIGSSIVTTGLMGNSTRPPVATPIYNVDLNDTASIEDEEFDYYTKRRNTLKIVIPALLSLALLLVVTAAVTTACACCCQRNKDRMKRYYKYKKLPETIEKT